MIQWKSDKILTGGTDYLEKEGCGRMKNLYNIGSIGSACDYCAKGRTTVDKRAVLCLYKGVMRPSDSCKHFTYNPLKREPKLPPEISAGALEEFVI